MAKSAKQQKIDKLKKSLWETVESQLQQYIDDETDVNDSYLDWDDVAQWCRDNADELVDVFGAGPKDYEGKLTVTAVDRRKILDEVEGSCLSDTAKESFNKLLKKDE